VAPASKNTYGQILKSSALIGVSSAVEIGLRIVRTKGMAILLGPSGVGLLGLYMSIADLAQTLAGMGINSSGVREIARVAGTGQAEGIGHTVRTLRRTSILLGGIGAALLVSFSTPISTLTFGGEQPASYVALLSLVVLFRLTAAGQQAVIQGMRRIADLARIAAWDALLGTCVTLTLVYWLSDAGLVPALVAAAATNLLLSWWYGRKVEITPAPARSDQVRQTVSSLLKLGSAFMASGLLMMGSAYAIRVIVLRVSGVEAAGLYQSAWTIGGLYLGFILQAMGTDFYPRLTAASHDDTESNRLVNEQTQIGLLLAGPGVLATLALTPIVITVLYSAQFQAAVEPLRWICLGMMLRVITWPLGFILVARGLRGFFVGIDLAYALVHIGLAWVCVTRWGVPGAGVAFFGSYLFHAVAIYPLARRVSGFRYSPANQRLLALFVTLIGLVFGACQLLPYGWATALGTLATVGSGVYAIRVLAQLVPLDRSAPLVRRLLSLLRLAPAAGQAP
jgi:PST family polysaccharide transporter